MESLKADLGRGVVWFLSEGVAGGVRRVKSPLRREEQGLTGDGGDRLRLKSTLTPVSEVRNSFACSREMKVSGMRGSICEASPAASSRPAAKRDVCYYM